MEKIILVKTGTSNMLKPNTLNNVAFVKMPIIGSLNEDIL